MYFNRVLLSALKAPNGQGKARLILGARQTGKSTLFELIRGPDDLLIDLQDRGERLRFSQDPSLLSRTILPPPYEPRHILIDEIQRVPELLEEIQLILDKHPGRFTFTITGSSARRLRRGSANLLPGRARLYPIFPVMLAEQSARGEKSRLLPISFKPALPLFPQRSLEDLLVMGSLPGAWGSMKGKDLESYAALYIEEEIQREAIVRNLGPFGRFLRLAAVESGQFINLTKISQESGLALSTIKGFYSVLEDTLVGFSILPYSKAARARFLKTPKFYFFDTGVRNALAGIPLESGILAAMAGHLFEHWLACELYWRIATLGHGHSLFHWRTVGGAEVDFVIETPKETVAVEAKFTANPRPKDASALEHFIDLNPMVKRGLVVCRIKRVEQLSRHVQAIPWYEV